MQSLTCLLLLLRAVAAVIDCGHDGAGDGLSVEVNNSSDGGSLHARSVSQHDKQDEHETPAGLSPETFDKYLAHPQDDSDGKQDVVRLDDIKMSDLSGLSQNSHGCFVFREY